MFTVIESVELFAVVIAMGFGFWLVDFIQRKTGHPLYDRVEDE